MDFFEFSYTDSCITKVFAKLGDAPLNVCVVNPDVHKSSCWGYILGSDICRLCPIKPVSWWSITLRPYIQRWPDVAKSMEVRNHPQARFIELHSLKRILLERRPELGLSKQDVSNLFVGLIPLLEEAAKQKDWEFVVQDVMFEQMPEGATAALRLPLVQENAPVTQSMRDLLLGMEQRILMYVEASVSNAVKREAIHRYTETTEFNSMVNVEVHDKVVHAMVEELDRLEQWKQSRAGKEPAQPPDIARMTPTMSRIEVSSGSPEEPPRKRQRA